MYKIGEVSVITNVPKKTLRYWESVGLLSPKKTDNFSAYRYYDGDSVERINQIKYLKQLGLSLAEIKNFNVASLDSKIKQLLEESSKKRASALELMNIQAKGIFRPVNFENDPEAIGHWKLIGRTKTKERALGNDFSNPQFLIKDLYLMPGGKEYYVIKWTKGKISICGDWNSYEIIKNRLILTLSYNNAVDCYIIYERVDNKEHDIEDFIILDDINKPFVRDKRVEGVFNYVSSVSAASIDEVNLEGLKREKTPFQGLYVMANGAVIWRVNGAYCKLDEHFYTKGYICSHTNLSKDSARGIARKYLIKHFNQKTYMIMEWKAADYMFAGNISYAILEKI